MTKTITMPKIETEKLFQDLSKPSLHVLSYALRHPDTWPEGFNWNFDNCRECAMGLAHRLWASIPEAKNTATCSTGPSIMGRAFAMPYETARDIFMGEGEWTRTGLIFKTQIDFKKVTPEMVADQIDKYLETVE